MKKHISATSYIKYNYQKKYDLVVSALSIHHLNVQEKEELYHFAVMFGRKTV
jgi:hypothetical protein